MVDYLVGLGHRRIVQVPEDPARSPPTVARAISGRCAGTGWTRRRETISSDFTENAGVALPGKCSMLANCRPRWSAGTTAARSASSMHSAAPAWTCRGMCRFRTRRQPARPTRPYRSDLGEPGSARAGESCCGGGSRTSRQGPYGAGVVGNGAASGGARDDGGSGMRQSGDWFGIGDVSVLRCPACVGARRLGSGVLSVAPTRI